MAATANMKWPMRLVLAAGATLAVAAALGAAFLRGPAPADMALPVMAEEPVVLPGGNAIYVQKYEVSVAEWNACHAAGACSLELRTRPGLTPRTQPATGLSYVDALEYLAWINRGRGRAFRLPTMAEWEVMARDVLPEAPDPIFTDPSLTWASAYLVEGIAPRQLRPQGGYSTSPEGVADLDGSVWEWTQDCYAPDIAPDRCPAFYLGGEHAAAMSYLIRDPARGGCAAGAPPAHLGLRLVADAAW